MLKYGEIKFNRGNSNGGQIKCMDAYANISLKEKSAKQNGAFIQHAHSGVLARVAASPRCEAEAIRRVSAAVHPVLLPVGKVEHSGWLTWLDRSRGRMNFSLELILECFALSDFQPRSGCIVDRSSHAAKVSIRG